MTTNKDISFIKNVFNTTIITNDIDNENINTENLTVDNSININGTTNSTDKDTGCLILEGGIGIEKDLHIGGDIHTDRIDSEINSSTLLIGDIKAGKIEIADTGITTEIEGPLECTENIKSNELDTITATTLLLGKSTATRVEIADSGIDTEIQGVLECAENIRSDELDTRTASPLYLGKLNATRVEVPKDLFVGGNITGIGGTIITGSETAGDNLTLQSTTDVTKGQVWFPETTDSSSTVTGALRIEGGVGIGRNVYIGNSLNIAQDLLVDNIDTTSATTLFLGREVATRVEIADSGITTEIEGPLECTENIKSNELDTITATPLLLGRSTATQVEIGDNVVPIELKGPVRIYNSIDRETAGTLNIGTLTANNIVIGCNTLPTLTLNGASISIGDTVSTTTINDDLDVTGEIDINGATNLSTSSGITTIGSSTAVTVSANGIVDINNTTESNGTSDGALIVGGGVGIAKNLHVGGDLEMTGSTNYCAWVASTGSTQAMTSSNVKLNSSFWGTPTINESRSFMTFGTDKFTINLSGFYSITVTVIFRQTSSSDSRLVESRLMKNTSTLLSYGHQELTEVTSTNDTISSMNYTYAGNFIATDTFHVDIRSINSTTGECEECTILVTRM